jgi:hypothetical protein
MIDFLPEILSNNSEILNIPLTIRVALTARRRGLDSITHFLMLIN